MLLINSVALLSLGGRLYVIIPVTALLLQSLGSALSTGNRLRGAFWLVFVVAVLLLVGALRIEADVSAEFLAYIGMAEGLFTSMSLGSFVQHNGIPLLSAPANFFGSIVNFIPSAFIADKAALVPTIQESGRYFESPLGATNLLVAVLGNFGWLGGLLFAVVLGWLLASVRKVCPRGWWLYFYLCSLLPFMFFRDGFSIFNKAAIFDGFIVMWFIVTLDRASRAPPPDTRASAAMRFMSPHKVETLLHGANRAVGPTLPTTTGALRIVIDGIIFSLQQHGGISVYFQQLIARLRRDSVESGPKRWTETLRDIPASGGALKVIRRSARPAERYRPARSILDGSVFHSSYYRLPSHPRIPSVVTVHDFTYERCLRGPRRWIHSAQKFAAIRAAQAVICVSESTREDLLELVGVKPSQRVYVIHNGVDAGFQPTDEPPAGQSFILFVGQRGRYKNFRLVAEALTCLPDLQLFCVGGGALDQQELRGLPDTTRHRIRHLASVENHELNRLYNQALCLVYPSSYEGFGIPVVEAMKAACPVVCIPCKAVIEVGKNALCVSAPEPAALARKIDTLASSKIRVALTQAGLEIAKSYDWERTYRETLQVYESVAAQ